MKKTASPGTKRIVLGIDPGTVVMGYGLVAFDGQRVEVVDWGILKPGQAADGYRKLQLIHETVCGLITKFAPQEFAIEAPFFGKNVQSMLKLGRAQGVAIAAAMQYQLPVTEYSPKKVKQSITGNGNAAKERVLSMLQTILRFQDQPISLDASDALAVALCHAFHLQSPQTKAAENTVKKKAATRSRKSGGWDAFIRENPNRVTRK
jgi:crossover junction endodeoxyribonuclease RuvC